MKKYNIPINIFSLEFLLEKIFLHYSYELDQKKKEKKELAIIAKVKVDARK